MPDPSNEAIRATVHQVLGQPEYAWWWKEHEPSRPGGIMRVVLKWIGELLRWLASLRTDAPVTYWVMMGSLLVVAIGLLAHAAWTVRVALRAQPAEGTSPRAAGRQDFLTLASGLAAGGDYLEAARHAQLAVLDLLVTRRVIRLERSEANLVLRERLRRSALPDNDRRTCLVLLDRLERAWFRDRAASRDLYADWCALHEKLSTVAA